MSSSSTDRQPDAHQQILQSLLVMTGHSALYFDEALFRVQMDLLVDIGMKLVDQLADDAAQRIRQHQLAADLIARQPPQPVRLNPDGTIAPSET